MLQISVWRGSWSKCFHGFQNVHDVICGLQDFLNGVCTHIIWLTQNRLTYYTGMFPLQSYLMLDKSQASCVLRLMLG